MNFHNMECEQCNKGKKSKVQLVIDTFAALDSVFAYQRNNVGYGTFNHIVAIANCGVNLKNRLTKVRISFHLLIGYLCM